MTSREILPGLAVSRETSEKLETYMAELTRWNSRINLVSRGDIDHLWERHILDSAQVFPLVPANAQTWLDLGAGAGLPGLVGAILAAEHLPALSMTLIEADARKAAFLREAARKTGLDVEIVARRIEDVPPRPFDVVTGRALAALQRLLGYAHPFCGTGTRLLLHKGAGLESELTEAAAKWNITERRIPSISGNTGTILEITELSPRQ